MEEDDDVRLGEAPDVNMLDSDPLDNIPDKKTSSGSSHNEVFKFTLLL